MNNHIAILTDTGSDLNLKLAERHNIYLAPLYVNIDNQSYKDVYEISPEEIYEVIDSSSPKTSTPSIGELKEIFKNIKRDGYTQILMITISSKLSSLYDTAVQAAKNMNMDIRIIDSKNIAVGTGLLAIYAQQLTSEDLDFDTLESKIKQTVSDSKVFFSIKTLKYLIKGGRIGLVQGFMGEILKVKPIISCNKEGVYYTVEKNIGDSKSLKRMTELVKKQVEGFKHYFIAVSQGLNPVDMEKIKVQLKDVIEGAKVYLETEIAPTLSIHTGPGLIGVGVLGYND